MEAISSRRPGFSDDAVLLEVHRTWIRSLVSRLHARRIVADRPAADVAAIYRDAVAAQPVLRRVLDDEIESPALADPLRREYSMLAEIAGLAPDGTDTDTAAERGRALIAAFIPAQRLAVG
jgi:hypothetical protein